AVFTEAMIFGFFIARQPAGGTANYGNACIKYTDHVLKSAFGAGKFNGYICLTDVFDGIVFEIFDTYFQHDLMTTLKCDLFDDLSHFPVTDERNFHNWLFFSAAKLLFLGEYCRW